MAINPVQKNHLGRELLLAEKIWQCCSNSIDAIRKQEPSILADKDITFSLFSGYSHLSKKTQEDFEELLSLFVFGFKKARESGLTDTALLYMTLEVLHYLVCGMPVVYPPLKEDERYVILDESLGILIDWVADKIDAEMLENAESEIAQIHGALTNHLEVLDGEKTYWYKGVMYKNLDTFQMALSNGR